MFGAEEEWGIPHLKVLFIYLCRKSKDEKRSIIITIFLNIIKSEIFKSLDIH